MNYGWQVNFTVSVTTIDRECTIKNLAVLEKSTFLINIHNWSHYCQVPFLHHILYKLIMHNAYTTPSQSQIIRYSKYGAKPLCSYIIYTLSLVKSSPAFVVFFFLFVMNESNEKAIKVTH